MSTTPIPVGPPGNPILGSLPDFRADNLAFLTQIARKYGDFVPLRFLRRRLIFINNPEYIEEVLVSKSSNFVKGPALRRTKLALGNGLLTSEGEFWRRQRRLVQPGFRRERINAYGDIMTTYTQRLLDTWHDGEKLDVHAEMMRLTLQIVAKALFDADVAADAPEVGAALDATLHSFVNRVRSAIWFPDWVPTPANLRTRTAMRHIDAVINRIVAEHRAYAGDRGDLLSSLLGARTEEGRPAMSERQLRDEMVTLFLAGHETTAIALSWTFYLLAQYPEVEQKLVAELTSVLQGRPAAVPDLALLPYTQAVVAESLRLYPPAYALAREAVIDTTVGPYPVAAGTPIIMSQWVMHRDPRYYEKPLEFNPDRWLDGLEQRNPKFAYFPFGGGPRKCIGSNFAEQEAALVLAGVVQRFHLSLALTRPVEPFPTVTLRPAHGMPMVVHKRAAASIETPHAA